MKLTPYSTAKIEFDDAKHVYLVNGEPKPGPSQLLFMVGLSPNVDNMPEPMRSNYIAAGNLGKVVHKWCEIYDGGDYAKYEPPKDREAGYLTAWIRFLGDFSPSILEAETPHYSEYGDYCGIPDRVVEIKNQLFIIDIKSSKSINPNARLQTMAYRGFFKEDIKRMIVQVKDDGNYKIYDDGTLGKQFMDDGVDKDNWDAVLRVAHLQRLQK